MESRWPCRQEGSKPRPTRVWLASLSLGIGIATALILALLVWRDPPKMKVMALVWPIVGLFGGISWLLFYLNQPDGDDPGMAAAVAKGSAHCGAGCALGDLIVEGAAIAWPGLAALFGYGALFQERTFALWIADYLVAFTIGVAFQYFAIQPKRKLSPGKGLVAAVKADAASITAWQVGMYGMMALAQFGWLRPSYGAIAPATSPVFWFVMQMAMLAGFATAYPVNWLLIRAGLKERM